MSENKPPNHYREAKFCLNCAYCKETKESFAVYLYSCEFSESFLIPNKYMAQNFVCDNYTHK